MEGAEHTVSTLGVLAWLTTSRLATDETTSEVTLAGALETGGLIVSRFVGGIVDGPEFATGVLFALEQLTGVLSSEGLAGWVDVETLKIG